MPIPPDPSLRLLLLSNSFQAGRPMLDHCLDAVADCFGKGRRVLVVPYALADHAKGSEAIVEALNRAGCEARGIDTFASPRKAVDEAQAFFVGGGNTFRLLHTVRERRLLAALAAAVRRGVPYAGVSAGANLAGRTIQTSNDMAIVWPRSPIALDLVPFNLNPHYVDRDPDSPHMGETRIKRIEEFHEENDISVLALREGAWMTMSNGQARIGGLNGGRWIARGRKVVELRAGDELPTGSGE